MNENASNHDEPVKRSRGGGGPAFHSKLEPFVDIIRESRRHRKTWREIAAALFHEKNCAITAQGVHQFYRRHLQRRAKGHWEDAQSARPNIPASRPEPVRQPVLAVTPASRPFRQPNPENITLNDPTKV